MFSTSPASERVAQNPIVSYLGVALLIGLVLLLAWLQFRWLTQLSHEEEARRRVALRVAATNYAEHVGRQMNLLINRVDRAAALPGFVLDEPLLDAAISLSADGSALIGRSDQNHWSPVTWAEVQQRLGRRLTDALLRAEPGHRLGLWLDPPAVVRCDPRCDVATLSVPELRDRVLAPAAQRMFADFDESLRLLVSIEGSGSDRGLYPAGARLADFAVTDLSENLLPGVPVLGPHDGQWLLKVNHGGSSLESAVARSHVRNLLLSASLLSLLALSIVLVVFNARRQAALARERLYFAAGVSHELRTPLAVIASAADNLADSTVADESRVRKYGELIRGETRRLRTMVENVLQFAQSASAPKPLTQAQMEVAPLIERVLAQCAPLLRGREVRRDIGSGLPMVRGDPAALESALMNLVINAARYAENGNWLAIRATAVRVRPRGRAMRISVSNPVRGKPDPNPERLFEPFYRGQNVRNTGPEGTGIGLAVARNVARQHGGGVSVDAARPGLITFTLFLPIHEPSDPAHTPG